MAIVFISYGQKDSELVLVIRKILEKRKYIVIGNKFSNQENHVLNHLQQSLKGSNYVFLFLTDPIINTLSIKNLVIAESVIASLYQKKLFVFESLNSPIPFTIPYLTDYVLFNPLKKSDMKKLKSVAKDLGKLKLKGGGLEGLAVGPIFPIGIIFMLFGYAAARKLAKKPTGMCPHCKKAYNIHAHNIRKFNCPCCRKKVVRPWMYDAI